MLEALFRSDSLLMIGTVAGLAGTAIVIVRDTATRARVERPRLVVEETSSEIRPAA